MTPPAKPRPSATDGAYQSCVTHEAFRYGDRCPDCDDDLGAAQSKRSNLALRVLERIEAERPGTVARWAENWKAQGHAPLASFLLDLSRLLEGKDS